MIGSMGADSCILTADIASIADVTTATCDDAAKYWDPKQKKCLCIYGVEASDSTTCRTTSETTALCPFTNCADAPCAFDATECEAHTDNTITDDDCFKLNAILTVGNTDANTNGCKCMTGFTVIFNQLNVWRCERTADIARTNCPGVVVDTAPFFVMTELSDEVTSQMSDLYEYNDTDSLKKMLKFHESFKCLGVIADADAHKASGDGFFYETAKLPVECLVNQIAYLGQCVNVERKTIGVQCDRNQLLF